MKYKILDISLYVISILAGILVVYLGEQTTSMIKQLFNTTIVFIILKVIVVISTIILNKKAGCDYDHDGRIRFTLIFLITQFIIYFIGVYIQTHEIFGTLISLVIILFYNIVPFISLGVDGEGVIDDSILVEKDIFGRNIYKDSTGKEIARGEKDIFGNEIIKDKNGKIVSESRTNAFTGETIYQDRNFNVLAKKDKNLLGDNILKDNKNKTIYTEEKTLTGNRKLKKEKRN